ncbi:magnesium chelatase subunit D [Variovorax sp. KK3]|uniref:magnesium chelatase subunit D n=1 Tax=Variovorax sp. KK3 TaxID=1855728 RepID=UPI00097BDF64|nr:magnesium chelatase subunit D [Variovorax sp. KK3]
MNTSAAAPTSTPAGDEALVAALLCVDAVGLGGVVVRAPAGPARDAWLRDVAALLPEGAPLRRLPHHVQDDRLLGGHDLAATLRAGRPVEQKGLLAESDGGIVIACMAERLSPRTAAQLAAVLDTQQVQVQRDGLGRCHAARIGLIALDEGIGVDERLPDALRDRLAFGLDLGFAPACIDASADGWTRTHIADARRLLPTVAVQADVVEALCAAALALGVDSLRGSVLALRAARAHAALQGRAEAEVSDAALAARLVLLPRATMLPDTGSDPDSPADQPEPGPAGEGQAEDRQSPSPTCAGHAQAQADGDAPAQAQAGVQEDRVLEAASAVLPPGLLSLLASQHADRRSARSEGLAGPASQGRRGRPNGVTPGHPRDGARLSLIDTLRAAAPWQGLRRRSEAPPNAGGAAVRVRREDFRTMRFKQRSETTIVFTVDASGSSALHRLCEAKGAVELLLADCYVRRDSVSLIAFRGRSAQVLLPPTRSLVRARRSLAGLAGGGGTPLATAIDATVALAESARRRGCTPVAVLLTDGCANVALDGTGGRERAGIEALHSARLMRASGIHTLVLDTSPHAQPPARKLADALGAVYLPLPHADAFAMSRFVRAAAADRALP